MKTLLIVLYLSSCGNVPVEFQFYAFLKPDIDLYTSYIENQPGEYLTNYQNLFLKKAFYYIGQYDIIYLIINVSDLKLFYWKEEFLNYPKYIYWLKEFKKIPKEHIKNF